MYHGRDHYGIKFYTTIQVLSMTINNVFSKIEIYFITLLRLIKFHLKNDIIDVYITYFIFMLDYAYSYLYE